MQALRYERDIAFLTYLDLGRKEEALATYKELQRVAPEKAKELYEDINEEINKQR